MKVLFIIILIANIFLSGYSFVKRRDWRVSLLHIFVGSMIWTIQVLAGYIEKLDDYFTRTKKKK